MVERLFRNASNGGRKRANLRPAPVCEEAGLLSLRQPLPPMLPCLCTVEYPCTASFLLARSLSAHCTCTGRYSTVQQSTQSLFSSSPALLFFHFRILRNHKQARPEGMPRVFVICSIANVSYLFASQVRSFSPISASHANACAIQWYLTQIVL